MFDIRRISMNWRNGYGATLITATLALTSCQKKPEAPTRPAPAVTVATPVSERLIE